MKTSRPFLTHINRFLITMVTVQRTKKNSLSATILSCKQDYFQAFEVPKNMIQCLLIAIFVTGESVLRPYQNFPLCIPVSTINLTSLLVGLSFRLYSLVHREATLPLALAVEPGNQLCKPSKLYTGARHSSLSSESTFHNSKLFERFLLY